jgi:hypothetical protein
VRFDNNWITDGSEVGLELRSANGTVRLRFSFIGGQQTYRILDGAGNRSSTIGYTANGTTLNLSLGTGNAYTLTAGNGSVSGNLTAGDPITWMEFFNNNAGSGSNYDVFVGAMTHTIATTGNQTITQNSSITRVSDTDGLPNSWWNQFNLAGPDRNANADHDNDGFTNAQEHALGTDPTSAASRFAAHSPERNGNNIIITWSSVSGKTYQVQSKSDLSGQWNDVGAPVIANGSTASSQPLPTSGTKHFYRVRLVP